MFGCDRATGCDEKATGLIVLVGVAVQELIQLLRRHLLYAFFKFPVVAAVIRVVPSVGPTAVLIEETTEFPADPVLALRHISIVPFWLAFRAPCPSTPYMKERGRSRDGLVLPTW